MGVSTEGCLDSIAGGGKIQTTVGSTIPWVWVLVRVSTEAGLRVFIFLCLTVDDVGLGILHHCHLDVPVVMDSNLEL